MRSGSARKSGKAKAGGGNSHPHTHTRFRLSVSILGEGGAFAVPTSAAPAVMRALRPLNVTPAAPVPGRFPSAVLGVKPTPRSIVPHPFLRPSSCGTTVRSLPVSPGFAKGVGGSGHRHAPRFSSPGWRSQTGVSADYGAGEARGGGWMGGAVLRRMRLTSLRRARGCPGAAATRAPLHLPTIPPSQPQAESGQDSGGDGVGWGEGLVVMGEGSPILRPPAVKVNVKESGRACPRLWVRARAHPGSLPPGPPLQCPPPPPRRPAPAGARWTPEIREAQKCVSTSGRHPSRVHLDSLRGGAFCCDGCGRVVCFSGSTGLAWS